MMLTIMLITDGSVRIMSYGSELTRGTSVYDFTVMGNDQIVEKYLSNEQIRPYVSNLNRMEIGNIKSTASDGISSPVDWSKFRKQIVQHLPQDVVDPATQEDGMYSFGSDQPAALNLLGLIDTGSSSPYLLPVSRHSAFLPVSPYPAALLPVFLLTGKYVHTVPVFYPHSTEICHKEPLRITNFQSRYHKCLLPASMLPVLLSRMQGDINL